MKKTALYNNHVKLNAKLVPFAGYQMPVMYNKINNEYYVGNSINELIKQNYTVLPFEIEQYICLGTPRDLNVYKFWYSVFK